MQQASLFPPQSLSVSEINRYLRELIKSDTVLSDVWVQGEIANLAQPASGHIYFTLKDATSSLKCVVWRPAAVRLQAMLQSGAQIEAHGAVGIYEQGGQYQLYVDSVRLTGEGELYKEYLRLKAKLESEGLFDNDRKRPLPKIPRSLGVVTSASGAALQDILNVLRRRVPLVEVVLAHCSVQGDAAPAEIVHAIEGLNAQAQVDVILVARGGGSMEDLWAFNDERVVRAIAASAIPVVTGIGHEIDFTLADFAADLRAPTPTAAAELTVPDREELRGLLQATVNQLDRFCQNALVGTRAELTGVQHRIERASPAWRIRNDRQRLDDLSARIETGIGGNFRYWQSRQDGLAKRLMALNPFAVLQRGYAIITKADGSVVASVRQVNVKETLTVKVSDGEMKASVVSTPGSDPEGERE